VVLLNPGFEAKAGVKFEAYIQGCTTAGLPPHLLRRILPKPVGDDVPLSNINAEGDVQTKPARVQKTFTPVQENKIINAEGDVKNTTPIKQKKNGTVVQKETKPDGRE
jgi:hypothetical protein